MTKQEFLEEWPLAYAEQCISGRYAIWSGEGKHKIYLGVGDSEREAWDNACEDSVF